MKKYHNINIQILHIAVKEVTHLILMDSESEKDIGIAADFHGQYKIDSETDFEHDEEGIEGNDDEERLAVKRRRKGNSIHFIDIQ